ALDIEFALDAISTPTERYSGEPRVRNNGWKYLGWLIAGLALIAGLTILLTFQPKFHDRRETQLAARFFVSMPENVMLLASPVLTPNGQRLAFVALYKACKRQHWVRPLDSLSAQVLPGAGNAFVPFWSPDSNSLAFVSMDGQLKKIDL